LKQSLTQIAATIILALGFATAARAQNPKLEAQDSALKTRAERAGLDYEYDRFQEFDSIKATFDRRDRTAYQQAAWDHAELQQEFERVEREWDRLMNHDGRN
jgi:hypothetical protein